MGPAVTVPITFVAAMQLGLFRNIGELSYLAIATTGNLMRRIEFGYSGFVENEAGSRRGFWGYTSVISTFAGGAVIGNIVTYAWNIHAVWVPAAIVAATLILLVVDDRRQRAT